MTPLSPAASRRTANWLWAATLAGVAVVVVVLGLPLLGGTAPARLSALEPADGALVTVRPSEIALDFSAPPDVLVMHLTVAAPDGGPASRGVPAVSGTRVTVPVTVRRAGRYLVGYHVELAGGAELSGVYGFTVASGAAAAATNDVASALPAASGGHHHELQRDGTTLALVLVDLVLVVALVIIIVGRPRRR
jgi:methionine-rich copper-binding protein CopC